MYSRPLPGSSGRNRSFGASPGSTGTLGRMIRPQSRPAPPEAAASLGDTMGRMPVAPSPAPEAPPMPESSGMVPLAGDMNAASYMQQLQQPPQGLMQPPQQQSVTQMPDNIAASYGIPYMPAQFPQPSGPDAPAGPPEGAPQLGSGFGSAPPPMDGAQQMGSAPGSAPMPSAAAPTPGADPALDPRKQQMNQMAAMQRGRQPQGY